MSGLNIPSIEFLVNLIHHRYGKGKEDLRECSAGSSYLACGRRGIKCTIVKFEFVMTARNPIGIDTIQLTIPGPLFVEMWSYQHGFQLQLTHRILYSNYRQSSVLNRWVKVLDQGSAVAIF